MENKYSVGIKETVLVIQEEGNNYGISLDSLSTILSEIKNTYGDRYKKMEFFVGNHGYGMSDAPKGIYVEVKGIRQETIKESLTRVGSVLGMHKESVKKSQDLYNEMAKYYEDLRRKTNTDES